MAAEPVPDLEVRGRNTLSRCYGRKIRVLPASPAGAGLENAIGKRAARLFRELPGVLQARGAGGLGGRLEKRVSRAFGRFQRRQTLRVCGGHKLLCAVGLATPSAEEHLARLETNGPWLEDLGVPSSTKWPAEEVKPGAWARVHHGFRLATQTCWTEEAASRLVARLDEGTLRAMRARYAEAFPEPDSVPRP